MIQFDAVTINRNLSRQTDWEVIVVNSSVTANADGSQDMFIGGPEILRGEIVIDKVNETEATAFRDWFRSSILYGKNTFTLTPSAIDDLGLGYGVALTDCYLSADGFKTSDVIVRDQKYVAKWRIRFPYKKALGIGGIGEL